MTTFAAAQARINAEVDKSGPPHRFSIEATRELLARRAMYFEDLGVEAARIASHAKSDSVSRSHIEMADARIRVYKDQWLATTLTTVGGVISGVGLPAMYTILTASDTPASASLIWSASVISALSLLFLVAGIWISRRR